MQNNANSYLQTTSQRSLHIYCDGGFGNRFNALVSGLVLAQRTNLKPIIIWPSNNWCRAQLNDIFTNKIDFLNRELISYVSDKERYHFFMTEDHLKMGVNFQSPLQLNNIEEAITYLTENAKDIFYYTSLIPAFIDIESLIQIIHILILRSHITHTAKNFLHEYQLEIFFGIHIRKTDFGINSTDVENLFNLVTSCNDKRFFICSDEKSIEERFKTLSNVVTYSKKFYVEKRQNGDWNTPTFDCSGRLYACNVERSVQSIIDAIVDLLILSRSLIVKTSNSTFLNTALLLKQAQWPFEIYEKQNITEISTSITSNTKKKLITFSLWGDDDFYCIGAIENAKIAPFVYPGWTCRFYIDKKVSQNIIQELIKHNTEVIIMEEEEIFKRYFWRFHPLSETNIERFISRDCDSRLNIREANAVMEWEQSEFLFHVMRDHECHTFPVMAGMWGARPCINNIKTVIEEFIALEIYKSVPYKNYYTTDQLFLNNVLWPKVMQENHLGHSEFKKFTGKEKDFKIKLNKGMFVGQVINPDGTIFTGKRKYT